MVKGGFTCIKYITFSSSLLFAFSGLLILLIGTIIQLNYTHYSNFVSDEIWTLPIVLIIIGSIMSFICCLGCCGALRENVCMILWFAALTSAIFLLEIGLGIAGFIKHTDLASVMEKQFNLTMEKYSERKDYRDGWSLLQTEMSCCGFYGPTDWENVLYTETLPASCCGVINLDEATECTIMHSYEKGCFKVLLSKLHAKMLMIIIFAAIVSGIQVLTILFSLYLCATFRRSYEIV